MKVPLPGITFVVRRERKTGAENFVPAAQGGARLPVKADPTLAPHTVDATSFYGYGRDPKHTWPTRDVVHALDIIGITSHMAPWFLFPKVPSAMVVGMATGAQMPVAGRPNIDSRDSTSYGSYATFRPDLAYLPSYASKLIGR